MGLGPLENDRIRFNWLYISNSVCFCSAQSQCVWIVDFIG